MGEMLTHYLSSGIMNLHHRTHRNHREKFYSMGEDLTTVNELTRRIIGSAMEVHRTLGPGLLESTYEVCLTHELNAMGLRFEHQKPLPISYKGVRLDCGYRLDIVVEDTVVLELKSVEVLLPVHQAQLLSYLKLSGYKIGLLINFNVKSLKDGIKRILLRIFSVNSEPSVVKQGFKS